VETIAGLGAPEHGIAKTLGIDPKALQEHYAEELEAGIVKANIRVAENLYRRATCDGREAVGAAIICLKAPAGWRETSTRASRP
jgi:hypothetical protein